MCPKCGSPVEEDAGFCGECGFRMNLDSREGFAGKAPAEPKKKNGMIVVIIVLIIITIAACAAVFGYIIYSNSIKGDTDQRSLSETDSIEKDADPSVLAVTASPAPSSGPNYMNIVTTAPYVTVIPTAPAAVPGNSMSVSGETVSQRPDLYKPSLTYKRMNGIGNTSPVDDNVFAEVKKAILDFDLECERYMNNQGGIPSMLIPGSTAYNQQTGYKSKHPSLWQTYDSIDVISAREGGGYYYVWVTEKMTVTENNSTKSETEHWVYKLGRNTYGLYIDDYTRDPAY